MKARYIFPLFLFFCFAMLSPLFASGNSVEIWVPIGSFLMVVLIVASVSFSRAYVKSRQYEVYQKYVESGKEIPADLLREPREKIKKTRETYLQNGLINLAVGLGLGLMFHLGNFGNEGLWAVGFIPGFIGIAHLIMYWKTPEKDQDKDMEDSVRNF